MSVSSILQVRLKRDHKKFGLTPHTIYDVIDRYGHFFRIYDAEKNTFRYVPTYLCTTVQHSSMVIISTSSSIAPEEEEEEKTPLFLPIQDEDEEAEESDSILISVSLAQRRQQSLC